MSKRTEFNKSVIEKEESFFAEFAEIFFVVLVALAIVFILKTQVTMARGVDGESMQPTYNSTAEYKEYIKNKKPTDTGIWDTVRITRLSKIKHGDIVTFVSNLTYRDNKGKIQNKILIKRVIGVGGDILEFKASGQKIGAADVLEVWRNGDRLPELYINTNGDGTPSFTKRGDRPLEKEFTVPKGCYFVMGDNRDNSEDSRFNSVGFIPKKKIEGKVYLYVPHGDNYVSALWHKIFT